jgi:hypothetical protein
VLTIDVIKMAVFGAETKAKDIPDLDALCRDLPKIELHRHLTGSLSNDRVRQILEVSSVELGYVDLSHLMPWH